jgi:hypothetical protein
MRTYPPNRTYAVVRGTALPAKEPGAETDGKNVNTHSEQAGDDKMSPFMNEDHHSENECHANEDVECHTLISPFVQIAMTLPQQ